MMVRRIEVDIEELVLHGFSPGDRYRIGEAVEQELTQLLADWSVPESLAQGGKVADVDAGAFEIVSGSRGEVVGAQVAQVVYGGLRR